MYWPAFLLIGLQFGSILALAAGILCIIPYIGPFIAFIPGLIIAFQDSTFMVVKFVIVWFAIQLIHGDFVIPRVMGDKLKVHPITILLVLLVMGELFGLMGVIFGIPMYCLVKVTVIYLFRKFKQRYNRFYGDNGEYEHTNFTKDQYLKYTMKNWDISRLDLCPSFTIQQFLEVIELCAIVLSPSNDFLLPLKQNRIAD